MVPPPLDSHMFDVQSFCFMLTMSHNVEGAMVEHYRLNLMIGLWMEISFVPILSEKLNWYNKLVKITMVQVHWEDERTFNNLFHEKQPLKLANNSLGFVCYDVY
jgi:hypothetical protein